MSIQSPSSINSSLSPPIHSNNTTQCILPPQTNLYQIQNPYTNLNIHAPQMNPYIFNPYAIAAAANTLPTQQTTPTTNPYATAAAAALNPTLAQAAALNAYTQNIAAVQQQLLTQQITNNTTEIIEPDIENEDDENNNKNKKNKLKVEHDGFYNMKPLLAENILSSDYFKSLYRFKTYHEVIDETQRHCKNVEPLMVGLSRKPSTAFCILYKFFTMELTVRQVEGLLNYYDSSYVRSIGFLYLRYLLPAKDLWKWFSAYFDDDQEFSPGADGKVIKIKQYAQNLLQLQKYYSTLLPRIPVKIERAYKKRLLQRQLIKKRDLENETFRNKLSMDMEIRAQWEDLKWYNAIIDECLENGKFLVTFTEYDDQCEITIGQIQLKKKIRSRSRSRSKDRRDRKRRRRRSRSYSVDSRSRSNSHSRSRSRSRSRHKKRRHHRSRHHSSRHRHRHDSKRDRHHSSRHDSKRDRDRDRDREKRDRDRDSDRYEDGYSDKELNDEKALEEMVRKKEMEAVVAIGRDYARRPTAYYHSLTLHLETGTNRKRSHTPPPNMNRKKSNGKNGKVEKKKVLNVFKPPSKQHMEKMRLLKLKYGDASKQ